VYFPYGQGLKRPPFSEKVYKISLKRQKFSFDTEKLIRNKWLTYFGRYTYFFRIFGLNASLSYKPSMKGGPIGPSSFERGLMKQKIRLLVNFDKKYVYIRYKKDKKNIYFQ
jgi:hypothetical protein